MKKDGKYVVLEKPVSKGEFNGYVRILSEMAFYSRAAYMDAGILRKALIGIGSASPNDLIAKLDKQYFSLRFPTGLVTDERSLPSAAALSNLSRNTEHPMRSYIIDAIPAAPKGELSIGSYFSTPDDFTGMVLPREKDMVISIKGTSSIKNIWHDLKSQIFPADLRTMMPVGTAMSSTNLPKTVIVPKAFLKPIQTYWNLLKSLIETHKPPEPCRLYITGHSLGGAYATMLAFVLAECGKRVFPWITNLHLITFGAPTTLSDGARNVFNSHLDGGYVTLDRVTSYGTALGDIITNIPAGYTHPGYRTLKTEIRAETNTGRAYHLAEYIPRVYTGQSGGAWPSFSTGSDKTAYAAATLKRMPNLVAVPVTDMRAQGFPHAQQMGLLFFGAFRLPGQKNAGYNDGKKSMTFVANFYRSGLTYQYVDGPSVPEAPNVNPGDDKLPPDMASAAAAAGGRRRTRRNTRSRRRLRYTRRTSAPT